MLYVVNATWTPTATPQAEVASVEMTWLVNGEQVSQSSLSNNPAINTYGIDGIAAGSVVEIQLVVVGVNGLRSDLASSSSVTLPVDAPTPEAPLPVTGLSLNYAVSPLN